MAKLLIGVVMALGVVIGIFAQNTAPFDLIATLDVDSTSALAITSDGEQLVVGTADGNLVQVYSLEDPANPRFLNAVELDGTPTALLGALDFALVTVAAEDGDLLQIVARPSYNPREGFINYGTYDIIAQPTGTAISPSTRWGIIYGEAGFTVLEILSVDEINSRTIEDASIASAAVANDGLLLLPTDDPTLHAITMGRGVQLGRILETELGALGRDLALNIRGTVGAVLLEDSRVVLFDPDTLEAVNTIELAEAYDAVYFLTREDAEWLILSHNDDSTLEVLDVSDPEAVEPVGLFELDAPPQSLAIYSQLMVVSDGQTVTIFAAD